MEFCVDRDVSLLICPFRYLSSIHLEMNLKMSPMESRCYKFPCVFFINSSDFVIQIEKIGIASMGG